MGYSKITALSLTDLFVQQIENMILSGELAFGEQLPPARELAAKMGVSDRKSTRLNSSHRN